MTSLQSLFLTAYELLLEDRAAHIKAKQGEALTTAFKRDVISDINTLDDLIEVFRKIDPTPAHKYMQWLANQYISDNFRIEDERRVRAALEAFERKKGGLEKKDINQYKTLSDLEDEVLEKQDHVSGKAKARLSKSDAEKVFEDSTHLVVIPHTHEASNYYGSGTKWCTTGSNDTYFKHYTARGPLYIIIDKTKKGVKFQWHPATGQFKNANDTNASPAIIKALMDAPVGDYLITTGLAQHAPKGALTGKKLESNLRNPAVALWTAIALVTEAGRRAYFQLITSKNIDVDSVALAFFERAPIQGLREVLNYNQIVRKSRWEKLEEAIGRNVDALLADADQWTPTHRFSELNGYVDMFVHSRSPGLEALIKQLPKKAPIRTTYMNNVFEYDDEEDVRDDKTRVALVQKVTSVAELLRTFDQTTKLSEDELKMAIKYAPVTVMATYFSSKKIKSAEAVEYGKRVVDYIKEKLTERHWYGSDVVNNVLRIGATNGHRFEELEPLILEEEVRPDEKPLGAYVKLAMKKRWPEYEKLLADSTVPQLSRDKSYVVNNPEYAAAHMAEYAVAGGVPGKWPELESAIERLNADKVEALRQLHKDKEANPEQHKYREYTPLKTVDGITVVWPTVVGQQYPQFVTHELKRYVENSSPDWKLGQALVKSMSSIESD